MLYAFSALVCLCLCSRGSSVSSSRSSGSVARTGPLAAAAALTACTKKREAPSAPAVLTSSFFRARTHRDGRHLFRRHHVRVVESIWCGDDGVWLELCSARMAGQRSPRAGRSRLQRRSSGLLSFGWHTLPKNVLTMVVGRRWKRERRRRLDHAQLFNSPLHSHTELAMSKAIAD